MDVSDLRVQIGNLSLEHPVMGGAGYCKDGQTTLDLAQAATAAVVFGSATILPRTGNEGDVYHHIPGLCSLNSIGLANKGKEAYRAELPDIASQVKALGKPFILSTAGFTLDEYVELAKLGADIGASAVEVNLGCPNIWDGGAQKRIASFAPLFIKKILRAIKQALMVTNSAIDLWVKLSPYSDPVLLGESASAIIESNAVTAVVTSNTWPNAFAWRSQNRAAISVGKGLGGMSGLAMKHAVLGQVVQFRDLLPSEIAVIGVGGVGSGQDVTDYLDAGATAVQVVTSLIERGPKVFGDILGELVDILEKRSAS